MKIISFLKKIKPSDALIALLLFHIVGNVVWIKLNNTPPRWDDSYNILKSVQFSQFFQDLSNGTVSTNLFTQSFADFYGPLVRIMGGIALAIFGPTVKVAQLVGTFFFIATLVLLYNFGKRILQNAWAGVLIAFIFSFFQIVYDNSRLFLLDIPLTFFIILTLYFLILSTWFTNKKYTLLSFLAAALATLTKIQAPFYLIPIFLYFFFSALSRKPVKTFYLNILIGSVLYIFFVGLWLIFSFQNILFYFSSASRPETATDPTQILSITTWSYYLKLFINNEITLFGFVLLIPALFYFIKKRTTVKYLLTFFITITYIIFTLFPNKDIRFLFPVLPAIAIIYTIGLYYLYKAYPRLMTIILVFLALYNVLLYSVTSFNFPLQKGYVSYVMLPFQNDINIINLSDSPVRKFQTGKWPYAQIVNDLRTETRDQYARVFFIPNYDYFNDNGMILYTALARAQYLDISRLPPGSTNLTDEKMRQLIYDYNYYIYTPSDVGIFYQVDREIYLKAQNYISQELKNGTLVVLKQYQLPSGEQIYLVKNTKNSR